MAYTTAPSGLSVARSGMKFTLSWKRADKDYEDGQQFQYRTNLDGEGVWHDVSIGSEATSKPISLSAADYYPTSDKKLLRIAFRVRGKRTATTKDDVTTYYDWSAWTSKVYYLDAPRRPSLTATLDSTLNNVTLFEWETETDSDDNRPTVNTEYQSMLIKNCTETDGSKLRWKDTQTDWISAAGVLSGSRSIEEDNFADDESYTRWFRIRSRGPAGASEWRYAKHVYARPNQAKIRTVESKVSNGITAVSVEWASATDASRPIDQSVVQYRIDVPAAGFTCPSGDNWTDAAVVSDTAGVDAVRFSISATLQDDQCLWVRILNQHDHETNDIPSAPELVRTGRLVQPSLPTVTNIDSTNYTATVTATNNSEVPDSKLAVVFRMNKKSWTIGIIDVHGGTSGSVTVQCPVFADATKIGFAVYAFQGTYTSQVTSRGTTLYTISENIRSKVAYGVSNVPLAPESVTVKASKGLTEAIISWDWTWEDADQAEISWSDRKTAWNSTKQPNAFIVEDSGATQWRVCGMEKGKTYYFKVRLGQTTEEGVEWGPYSETEECGFYSKPAPPVVQISEPTVKAGDTFTVSWSFSSSDGLKQASAVVCAFPTDVTLPDVSLWEQYAQKTVGTAHAVNIKTNDRWDQGIDWVVYVKAASKSGLISDWSEPVYFHIPAALTCTIESTTLETVGVSDGDGDVRSFRGLTQLPLTVVVSGSPSGGQTTLMIEREDDYRMIRPDGTALDGYAGEVVYLQRKSGGTVTFNVYKEDLIGRLDDGAKYILTAIVSADNAISARSRRHFEVFWSQKAIMPDDPDIEMLDGNAVKITPRVTTSRVCTCDVYRLSADRPELIVSDGTFGVPYVDPYPAIGDVGGYRVVYKGAAGDYITASGQPAWTDAAAGLDEYSIIIDFNGKQVILPYDMTLQSRWAKSFTKTVYLGGSVQGDWNVNVDRTAAYTVDLLADDPEVSLMRELADYTGICHIRTPEGSSYSCNIDVSENKAHANWDIVTYTLSVTRIDPEALDGLLYEEWIS